MRIIWTRNRSIGSILIRAAAWGGRWSHCGLVMPDGSVIESVALQGGVIRSALADVIAKSTAHQMLNIPVPDAQSAYAWAESTLGMAYDWGGVFGIPAREHEWQSPDRWYCSEHCAYALKMAGRDIVRPESNGIHPETLHAVAWAIGGREY